MNSIIEILKEVITDHISHIDEIAEVITKYKGTLTLFNQEEKKKREAVSDEMFESVAGRMQDETARLIDDIINRAKSYVNNTIIEPDYTSINRLEIIFKASEGNPSEYAMNLIKESLQGDYWGLLFVWNKTSSGDNVSTILNQVVEKPEPEYYISLLDEIENTLITFISSYNGPSTLTGTTVASSKSILFLSSTPWESWAERININSLYINEFSLANPALTMKEKTWLEQSIGAAGRSTQGALRDKVIELLQSDVRSRDILIRSQFASIVREYEQAQEQEEVLKQLSNIDNKPSKVQSQLQRVIKKVDKV